MSHHHFTRLVLVVIAGCGGKTAGTIACATQAAAFCDKLDACEKSGIARIYGDRATCESRQSQACEISLGAADTGSTPQGKVTCASAYAAASCRDFLYGGIAACATVTGSRTAGAGCTYGTQCQSGVCGYTTGAACGTCAAVSQSGSACPCGYGFVCVSGACQPGGNVGAPCGNCLAGLTCVSATCQAYSAATGLPCPCDSYAGFACFNGSCVAQTFATAGQPCGTLASGPVACTGGATCVIPSGSTQGTCTPYAEEGQSCGAPGPSCRTPERCVGSASSGTCVTLDPSKC